MESIRCFFVWFPRLNIMMQQMPHSSTGAVALGHLATLQRLKSLCVSGWEPQNGNQGEVQLKNGGRHRLTLKKPMKELDINAIHTP